MQDELLIRRAQRGDADAFEQLLLEHQKNVYNLCYRMAGNPDDAMDLSQETFLRAWRCLDQYQFASAFSTWLYRLCSNICIDFLRRRRRQQTVPLTFEDADGEEQTYAVPDAQPLPEEQVELKLTREILQAAMTQLLCCVCGMATGSTRATPYAAAGALLILACQWGLYLEAETRRSAYHLLVLNGAVPYVVSATETGVCRQRGTEEGFYRLMSRPDPARYWQNYAMPLVMAVAAVLSGVVCFSDGNMSDFPWVLTALTTAGAGLSIPLSGVLPMYYLSRRLGRSGCAAAGYAGARAVSRSRRLILTDDDLFPPGTVTLNGYKVFGEERARAVSYAASVAKAAGSSLTPLLERQLTAEGGFHLPVEWLNYCEEGGVEANIRGETVLMGSAYFMKKRRVALPRDMKLSTGVFLAVDGALTAVFAVKYQPSRNAEWALRTLKRFHITPVLAVRSGNVTPGLIKRKFGVDARPVYPDVSTRLALAQLAEQRGEQPYVIVCREGLMPLVESVAGSRRAVKAVRTATILGYIGAAVGVALAYYLTSIGNFALLTPIAMVVYQLLWLLPTLLLAGLVKHY